MSLRVSGMCEVGECELQPIGDDRLRCVKCEFFWHECKGSDLPCGGECRQAGEVEPST